MIFCFDPPPFLRLLVCFLIADVLGLSADPPPASAIEGDLQFSSFSSTSLTDEGGEVARSNWSWDVSIPLFETDWTGLELDLSFEKEYFRFKNFAAFLAGRTPPVSGTNDLGLEPSLIIFPKRSCSIVLSPKLEYSGSEHARFNASSLWSLSSAVIYQRPTGLKVGLGLTASQRGSGPVWVLPFPVIEWQISERWNLTALDGESGRLSYRIRSAVTVYGELQFKSRDIRLSPSSSIPGGLLRTEEFPILLGIEDRLSPRAVARFAFGKALLSSYRFEDREGRMLRHSAGHSPLMATVGVDLTY